MVLDIAHFSKLIADYARAAQNNDEKKFAKCGKEINLALHKLMKARDDAANKAFNCGHRLLTAQRKITELEKELAELRKNNNTN